MSKEYFTSSPSYVAFLDACTLVPSSLRDLLLRSAASGLFQVHWSADILGEVRRTLVGRDLVSEERANHLLATMNRAFPEAEVFGYQGLIEGLGVDPKDRHVLAAAVVAHADVIVTRNVRHFPNGAVTPFGIAVQTPDEFVSKLAESFPEELAAILLSRADDLGDSISETLEFVRLHIPGFVDLMESRNLFVEDG